MAITGLDIWIGAYISVFVCSIIGYLCSLLVFSLPISYSRKRRCNVFLKFWSGVLLGVSAVLGVCTSSVLASKDFPKLGNDGEIFYQGADGNFYHASITTPVELPGDKYSLSKSHKWVGVADLLIAVVACAIWFVNIVIGRTLSFTFFILAVSLATLGIRIAALTRICQGDLQVKNYSYVGNFLAAFVTAMAAIEPWRGYPTEIDQAEQRPFRLKRWAWFWDCLKYTCWDCLTRRSEDIEKGEEGDAAR